MEFQHITAKVFVEGDLPFDPSLAIEVFHRWIQSNRMPELLIDVADYAHVPDGPGVMLIAHEANYSLDHTDGRWGMCYNRKAAYPGSNADRFSQALSSAIRACREMEQEFADRGLRFSRSEFEILVNDRALAPNTETTRRVFEDELRAWIQSALGQDAPDLGFPSDLRRRVGADVRLRKPMDQAALQALSRSA